MRAKKVTGSFENNREIIDMCRNSKTPALMDRRVFDLLDGAADKNQVYLSALNSSIWLEPGMWVIEIREDVFDVAHNYN